ncbi:MAG: 8-amino-7-oxononanoate synthase, partial [Candidatus Hydrogenedentota bacterium]
MKGIREELAAVPAELRRALRIVPHGAEAMIEKEGRRLVNLATNNYLSLATHPEVIEAAVRALREDGAGAGSSRLILGTSPRVAALEDSLAGL